jgi:hypothetical protein
VVGDGQSSDEYVVVPEATLSRRERRQSQRLLDVVAADDEPKLLPIWLTGYVGLCSVDAEKRSREAVGRGMDSVLARPRARAVWNGGSICMSSAREESERPSDVSELVFHDGWLLGARKAAACRDPVGACPPAALPVSGPLLPPSCDGGG